MTQKETLTLPQRLHGLAAFLPQFEQPDFCFGHWAGGEKTESGVLTIPYFSFSAVADEFIRAAYDLEWVRLDFDWPAWAQTPEAAQFRDDARAISNATPEQLSRLLTTVIRQDRFCDGELAEAFESGLLTAICRRAAQLESEVDGGIA
jgi:hypothetical protein